MNKRVKILHLEDLASDAEIIRRVLNKGDFEFDLKLVDNKREYELALDDFCPDIVLSDHSLPSFDSLGALAVLKEKDLSIPFILITAAMSEEFAVLIMKQGADDYILKDRLQRLPNAVLSALEKKRIESEHKKFLDKLIANEALLKETEHLANIGSFKVDLLNDTVQWSEQLYNIFDYKRDEVPPSLESFMARVYKDDVPRLSAAFENMTSGPSPLKIDYRVLTNNGTIKFIYSELFLKCDAQGQGIEITGFTQDISLYKKAEEKVMKANRLYAFISQINQTIIHADTEHIVFKDVCQIAINTGKFAMAWIGIVDSKNKKINLVEQCGAAEGDTDRFTDVSYVNNGPKEYVIKMGTYFSCNNIEKDPGMANSRSFASSRGFGSCIMLPIKKSDRVYGVLNLYSTAINFFDPDEIKLLEEVAGDISFALDNFEKEKQRRLAQAKLSHNESILKQAQEIAHIGNWELDFSTGISKWSVEACRIYGLSAKDNVHPYETWLSFIHPEDLDFAVKTANQISNASDNTSFYHRIVRKDGSVRYIHSITQVQFGKDGKATGINGVVHDVTEEKKTELIIRDKEIHLRGILDSTDNGILAVNRHNQIINFNNPFTELWQIPKELVKDRDINTLLEYVCDQLIDPEEFIAKAKEQYNSDGTSFDLLQFKDGRVFERFSTPLILNNERVGRVLSFKDITERGKHIKAIEEQNLKLREIAWIQSHVVRAPLSRILGLVDLLKTGSIDEPVNPELLDHVYSSATELDNVIRSIVIKTEEVVRKDRATNN